MHGNLLRTAHATRLHREINPRRLSLSLLHSDGAAAAADKHYLVCDHVHSVITPLSIHTHTHTASSFRISQSGSDCVDTVGCHTVSSVGVSVASVAVTSQKTQGNVSLLTSSVCLASCLITGVCTGSVGAQAANKSNPPFAGNEGIWPPNKHASLFLALAHAQAHTHTSPRPFDCKLPRPTSSRGKSSKHLKFLPLVLNL